MSERLNLEGKDYVASRYASEMTGYTTDYIGQLARKGVFDSKMIGNVRFIDEKGLQNYIQKGMNSTSKESNTTRSVFDGMSAVEAALLLVVIATALTGFIHHDRVTVFAQGVVERAADRVPDNAEIVLDRYVSFLNEDITERFQASHVRVRSLTLTPVFDISKSIWHGYLSVINHNYAQYVPEMRMLETNDVAGVLSVWEEYDAFIDGGLVTSEGYVLDALSNTASSISTLGNNMPKALDLTYATVFSGFSNFFSHTGKTVQGAFCGEHESRSKDGG